MPFDSMPQGDPWGLVPRCMRCRRPIPADEVVETLRFEPCGEHRLDELNGPYHAECARPYLSVARALDMLGRSPF